MVREERCAAAQPPKQGAKYDEVVGLAQGVL